MEYFVNFTNKNILLTGAASGIGKTTALELSKYGANLVLFDINEDGLEETKKQCSTNVCTKVVDLSNTDNINMALKEVVNEVGKLDGFAHIAGIPSIMPLKTIDKASFDKIMSVNTYPALELAKFFSNKRYRNENGSIVLISSVYANVGSSANVLYSASKASIQGITKSLAIELAPKGVRVNCIAPGFIQTKMGESINHFFDASHDEYISSLHPLGLGQTKDVANAIIFLLSDKSKWITGSIINVDGGFCAQ